MPSDHTPAPDAQRVVAHEGKDGVLACEAVVRSFRLHAAASVETLTAFLSPLVEPSVWRSRTRLRERSKPPTVDLVGVMRRLVSLADALLHANRLWQPSAPPRGGPHVSHRTFRHSWKSPLTSNTDDHLSLDKTLVLCYDDSLALALHLSVQSHPAHTDSQRDRDLTTRSGAGHLQSWLTRPHRQHPSRVSTTSP